MKTHSTPSLALAVALACAVSTAFPSALAADKASGANAAIMAYLGDPVPPPASLDPRYTPAGLQNAFTELCQKLGYRIERLGVDDTEYPYVLYGIVRGPRDYHDIKQALASVPGYAYSGSSTGQMRDGTLYFALNMVPAKAYPRSHAEAISRRMMIRIQMLAAAFRE